MEFAPGIRLREHEVELLGRLAHRAGGPRAMVLSIALHLLRDMPIEELRKRVEELKRRREREARCRS